MQIYKSFKTNHILLKLKILQNRHRQLKSTAEKSVLGKKWQLNMKIEEEQFYEPPKWNENATARISSLEIIGLSHRMTPKFVMNYESRKITSRKIR